METYLYFGEGAVETTGTSALYPLSSFLGMTPAAAAQTTMHFKARNGTAVDDGVVVVHTGHTTKAFMTAVVKYMQPNRKNPFLVIQNAAAPTRVDDVFTDSVAVTTVA